MSTLKQNGVKFELEDIVIHKKDIFFYEEFTHVSISAKTERESSNILNSIWREINQNLAFDGKDRCPWMYVPTRKVLDGKSYLLWGKMSTRINNIVWACSFEKKGVIQELAFMPYLKENRRPEIIQYIKINIMNGIDRVNEVFQFTAKCIISGRYQGEDYYFEKYSGEKFKIDQKNNYSELIITDQAYHIYDFENRMKVLVPNICDFLSVETNTLVNMGKIEVCQEKVDFLNDSTEYIDNKFIDFASISDVNKILLSKEAVLLLDYYISEYELIPEIENIINSANVFREGLELQNIRISNTVHVTETTIASTMEKNSTSRVNMFASVISLYMSALENLTVLESNPESCPVCGQLKYGITSRVGQIGEKYFNKDMGNLLKKIYSKRSKYFHTAISFSKDNDITILPQLDGTADAGCQVTGFVSILMNGQSILISPNNIRDWIAYIIRQEANERIKLIS